jgi:hypothetical protein
MKYTAILLIACGILSIFIGAMFKIMHYPYANLLMQLGLTAQWLGIGLLIYFFVQKRKKKVE